MTNFCEECRWFYNHERSTRCAHDLCLDVVDGTTSVYCTEMRKRYAMCGPDGKLWEAKTEPQA
jgi:hypothetical protein